jgi:hypothetical protein
MDAATLQARINAGYGKASQRIGYLFTIYRPRSGSAALVPGNVVGAQLNAIFTVKASTFSFGRPGDYKNPLWLGLFDPTTTKVGDYLSNPTHGTWFIIALQDQLPVLCVECNNTISIVRPGGSPVLGVGSYSGASPATETPIITSWPASLILDARGRSTGANLPLDEQNPFFLALLPAFAGADIRPSDILIDGDTPARRYIVAASEFSPFGWRMMVQHATS